MQIHAMYCAVKLVMNAICKVFDMKYSAIDARLTSCLVPKVSINSTRYFRKHNFRNDHVVTKIFYYENLELYSMLTHYGYRYDNPSKLTIYKAL